MYSCFLKKTNIAARHLLPPSLSWLPRRRAIHTNHTTRTRDTKKNRYFSRGGEGASSLATHRTLASGIFLPTRHVLRFKFPQWCTKTLSKLARRKRTPLPVRAKYRGCRHMKHVCQYHEARRLRRCWRRRASSPLPPRYYHLTDSTLSQMSAT